MSPGESRKKVEAELQQAAQARAEGNEGMARVCARRAAGAALAALAERRGRPGRGHSAYNRLRALAADEAAPEDVRLAALRLTARITPEHTLPSPEDPLADARLVIAYASSAP